MIRVDSHLHVWDPAQGCYRWLEGASPTLNRAIRFDEVQESLRAAAIPAVILVQADDSPLDTDFMIDTARAHAEVVGIVASVDLDRPESIDEQLGSLADSPYFVGVRNLAQNHSGPDWMLGKDFEVGFVELVRRDVCFDIVVAAPDHLEFVITLAQRHPQLRIVIDHLGHPNMSQSEASLWCALMTRVSEQPNVFAKVSGLYLASDRPETIRESIVRSFFDRALELFGADRLMYGGDWPICNQFGGYAATWAFSTRLFELTDARCRSAIEGGTAVRVYRISAELLAAAAARSRDD